MANETTVLRFKCDSERFFEAVRSWALSYDFKIVEKRDDYKLYVGSGYGLHFGGGPRYWLLAKHDGHIATLEAWISLKEGEKWAVHSGPFSWSVHRKKYGDKLNVLLDLLEEPRI